MADPTSQPGWLSVAANKLRAFAYGGEDPNAAKPRVGLALSGGFARGIAHIGVIRTLLAAHIPIDFISGTSVGALIGAVYCAGTPLEEMERIGLETTFADFGRWTPSWIGLATNQRLEKYLARFTSATTFEQLKTPLIDEGVQRTFSSEFLYDCTCAQFEALFPTGDRSWFNTYRNIGVEFSNKIHRIVSFQGARFVIP